MKYLTLIWAKLCSHLKLLNTLNSEDQTLFCSCLQVKHKYTAFLSTGFQHVHAQQKTGTSVLSFLMKFMCKWTRTHVYFRM